MEQKADKRKSEVKDEGAKRDKRDKTSGTSGTGLGGGGGEKRSWLVPDERAWSKAQSRWAVVR